MHIFIICSKKFYEAIPDIKRHLETRGHRIVLPNSFDDPDSEERLKLFGEERHARWKAEMFKRSREVIESVDAGLVLNFEKNGMRGYVGGATFLEMYELFKLGKKIFMYHDIPESILSDEIAGFRPIVIGGDLKKIV